MAAARRFAVSLAVLLSVAYALMILGGPSATAQEESSAQTLWGVYWTVQPGFTSTLEMKNNLVAEPLSVSVSLYFANGEEYPLSPVQLGPRQTAIIDLNRAIESLPSAVAARAGQEGTLEVEFVAPTPSALMGSVSVANPERGIAWNFFLYPLRSGLPIAPLRGVFWFPNSGADGFVAMQNVSEEFLSMAPRFHIAGQAYPLAPISLAPGQGHKLNFRAELRKLGVDDVTGGGIELRYEGVADALKAHGVLFDNRGFSAEVDFTRFESWDEAQTVTLRTPRFAVGQADSRLGLPVPTVFEPVLALHNFNAHALDVTLLVGYRVGTENYQQSIPISMAPGDTRILQLHPLLKGVIPADVPWASLQVSYTDRHTGLASAMVSVSQDGAHSIRSVLNWVRGNIREGWYWRADVDHTTLLGILNSEAEEAQVAVSLDYSVAGVARSYELAPLTIQRGSAANIDIGEIISSGQPDADGDVIPPGVSFGGYRVRKLGELRGNLTTEALVVNRRQKGFLTFYNTACCLIFPRFWPSEKEGVVGDNFQIEITATNTCTYDQEDLTGSGTHSSNNTNVVTVGVFTGWASMVGVGTTSIYSYVIYPKTIIEQCKDFPASDYCYVSVNRPVPVNFRQTSASDIGNGVLQFTYAWDSSTGSLSNLSDCVVSETVTYPGGNPYCLPEPFPAICLDNPTIIGVPGSDGVVTDTHGLEGKTGSDFRRPYFSASTSGQQTISYSCGSGSATVTGTLLGPLSIERSVSESTNNRWKYTITKPTNGLAKIDPLPE